jgi:hypothetical protein
MGRRPGDRRDEKWKMGDALLEHYSVILWSLWIKSHR